MTTDPNNFQQAFILILYIRNPIKIIQKKLIIFGDVEYNKMSLRVYFIMMFCLISIIITNLKSKFMLNLEKSII